MPKSYEWLAIYILSPHKRFGYFIKCFAIFFQSQTKDRKYKTEKKNKRGRTPGFRPTWPSLASTPAQPTRGRAVFYPGTGRLLVGVAAMPRQPRPPPASPALPPRRWTPGRPGSIFPLPWFFPSPSLASSSTSRGPRLAAVVRHRGHWPPRAASSCPQDPPTSTPSS